MGLRGVRTPGNLLYMNNTAATLTQVNDLDTLSTPATVKVQASKLRECMVLVDPETGTPAMWLDHKLSTTRNSGQVTWMAHDLETGRLETINLRNSLAIRVLAA